MHNHTLLNMIYYGRAEASTEGSQAVREGENIEGNF